jgi:hypothetical protein
MKVTKFVQLVFAFAMVSTGLSSPLLAREDCQCAICDVGPGDCQGDDLTAYNSCVAVTLGQCGRDCGTLEAGTGAQEGCYAAQIGIQKPCENACVQTQLRNKLCQDDPDSKVC